MVDTEAVLARDITRDELISELRALRSAFEGEGVTHMALFGSRARQDNRPDSDVDVTIEVDPTVKFSLLDLAGIGHLIEDNVGLRGNITMQRSLRPDMRARVNRDKVEVF